MGHSHVEHHYHVDHQEPPKRAILATVRASHARGRCRQGQVRQILADTHLCPAHGHGTPVRNINNMTGRISSSDVEEAEDTEENEHGYRLLFRIYYFCPFRINFYTF